jgi:hypothetical protein
VLSDKPANGNKEKKKVAPKTQSEGSNSKDNSKDKPKIKIELLKNVKSISDLKPEQYDKLKKELRNSCFKCGSYDHQSRECKSPKPAEQNSRADLFKALYRIVSGKEEKDKPQGIYAISEIDQTFKSKAYQKASLIISNSKEENLKVTIAENVMTLIDTGNQTGSTFISKKLAQRCAEVDDSIVEWEKVDRSSQPLDGTFKPLHLWFYHWNRTSIEYI